MSNEVNVVLKKLVIINPWVGKTGPNTFLCGLFPGLTENGYQVTILYPTLDDIALELISYGCEIIYLPFLERENFRNPILKFADRLFTEARLANRLFSFSPNSFDCCIINTEIFSLSLSFLPKIPTLIVVHSLSFSYHTVLSKWVIKLQQKFVSKYLAVSNIVKTELVNIGVTKPIEVVHNGVNESFFDANLLKPPSAEVFRILCVLYPVPHKGAHLLVEVLRSLKLYNREFQCKVIGWHSKPLDKCYAKAVKNAINEFDLESNISFHSATSDIKKELLSCDILLHPSLTESFGYILAEAMATEVPVIAFNTGGIPEIIQNRTSGILIEAYNCMAMANAVVELMDDTELRLSLAKNGRKRILANFNASDKVNQVIKIINSLSSDSQDIK